MAITVNSLRYLTRSDGPDGRIFARANLTIGDAALAPLAGTLVASSGSGSATQLPAGFVVIRCDLLPAVTANSGTTGFAVISVADGAGLLTLPQMLWLDQANQQLANMTGFLSGSPVASPTISGAVTARDFLVEAIKLT